MGWENPMTLQAAMILSIQMSDLVEHNDMDDLKESSALLDCTVLAHKFFEQHLCGSSDLEDLYHCFSNGLQEWDADLYAENESTLFMMMDFCLYPRSLDDYGGST
jgi:hypothetical protein